MAVDYLVMLGYLLAIVGVGWWGKRLAALVAYVAVSLATKPTEEAAVDAWRRRVAGEPATAPEPAPVTV
ncbi:hypothetical protein [Streptomyces sp. BRA346]|uniref:hypothetical protein n=1 Tax=Streptomyces sp. BRA346 TaxID=2878199 RepID=UPI004062E21C